MWYWMVPEHKGSRCKGLESNNGLKRWNKKIVQGNEWIGRYMSSYPLSLLLPMFFCYFPEFVVLVCSHFHGQVNQQSLSLLALEMWDFGLSQVPPLRPSLSLYLSLTILGRIANMQDSAKAGKALRCNCLRWSSSAITFRKWVPVHKAYVNAQVRGGVMWERWKCL